MYLVCKHDDTLHGLHVRIEFTRSDHCPIGVGDSAALARALVLLKQFREAMEGQALNPKHADGGVVQTSHACQLPQGAGGLDGGMTWEKACTALDQFNKTMRAVLQGGQRR